MSRRITIATTMDNVKIVEESLTELEAQFAINKGVFSVHSVKGEKFRYRPFTLNCGTGKADYDEDCRLAADFAANILPQTYNKNLVLGNMALDGTQVAETYVADGSTFIAGFEGVIEAGDVVIRSFAPL